MNPGTLEGAKGQIEQVIKTFQFILEKTQELEGVTNLHQKTLQIISQKENAVGTREKGVEEQKDAIERSKLYIEQRGEEQRKEQSKIEQEAAKLATQRLVQIEAEKELDKKKLELARLEQEKKELDDLREELTKKAKDLEAREANVQKEILIARERRERLDIEEKALDAEKTRIKQMLRI